MPISAVEPQPGTATFCLGGTRFGPGSNIKCNTKVKIQKLEANFLGNNVAFSIEKARFFTNILLLKNCAN
jgi:hypothetical protein